MFLYPVFFESFPTTIFEHNFTYWTSSWACMINFLATRITTAFVCRKSILTLQYMYFVAASLFYVHLFAYGWPSCFYGSLGLLGTFLFHIKPIKRNINRRSFVLVRQQSSQYQLTSMLPFKYHFFSFPKNQIKPSLPTLPIVPLGCCHCF